MAGFPCISITMQAGDLHSPGVGFWSFADNGLQLKIFLNEELTRLKKSLSKSLNIVSREFQEKVFLKDKAKENFNQEL